MVLLGVAHTDTEADAYAIADKLVGLRVFPDDDGKMNRSVADAGGSVQVVSQFTLYADARKGRRPSFVAAAAPDGAAPLVEAVRTRVDSHGVPTAAGAFGEHMAVTLCNDGPVTILLETEGGRIL
jgi:D-tyrosyl-tRNA(Tyr) deacylase